MLNTSIDLAIICSFPSSSNSVTIVTLSVFTFSHCSLSVENFTKINIDTIITKIIRPIITNFLFIFPIK